jgi:hypothetical protein
VLMIDKRLMEQKVFVCSHLMTIERERQKKKCLYISIYFLLWIINKLIRPKNFLIPQCSSSVFHHYIYKKKIITTITMSTSMNPWVFYNSSQYETKMNW